jgi:hypothetical protein
MKRYIRPALHATSRLNCRLSKKDIPFRAKPQTIRTPNSMRQVMVRCVSLILFFSSQPSAPIQHSVKETKPEGITAEQFQAVYRCLAPPASQSLCPQTLQQ